MPNADVLPVNTRPASYVVANIHVEEVSFVDADASIRELWHFQRAFVHFLQRKAGNFDVCCGTKSMLAVVYSSGIIVVRGAAITTVNVDRRTRDAAQVLKGQDEPPAHNKISTTPTCKLSLRKMIAQIAHWPFLCKRDIPAACAQVVSE
jgi:hypothetical protein